MLRLVPLLNSPKPPWVLIKTLTLDEITEIFDRIAIDVEKKHNAKLRNN